MKLTPGGCPAVRPPLAKWAAGYVQPLGGAATAFTTSA
jgi:hypothetical protein